MKLTIMFSALTLICSAQPEDPQGSGSHLTAAEISAAVAAKQGSGAVYIKEGSFATPSECQAQMPGVFIYTPAGWLTALSSNARAQYLSFEPKAADTRRLLTIIAKGCANGTPSGPVCESVTRVALLSEMHGGTVVEATEHLPVAQSWQNKFGARAECSDLLSKFPMSEVQKVRKSKGEFFVAVFGGVHLLKVYTVKEKHLKSLGL